MARPLYRTMSLRIPRYCAFWRSLATFLRRDLVTDCLPLR